MNAEFYKFVVDRMKEEVRGTVFPRFLIYANNHPEKLKTVLIKRKLLARELEAFRSEKGIVEPCSLDADAQFLIDQIQVDFAPLLAALSC